MAQNQNTPPIGKNRKLHLKQLKQSKRGLPEMGERSCPRDDCGYSVARTMAQPGYPTPLPVECPNCGTELTRHGLDE